MATSVRRGARVLVGLAMALAVGSGVIAHPVDAATKKTKKTVKPTGSVSMTVCSAVLTTPGTVPLVCGSDVAIAQKVVWKNWGTKAATGKGTLISSLIAPQAVTITLDRLTTCGDGRRFYGRASFAAKKLPKGAAKSVALTLCAPVTAATASPPVPSGTAVAPVTLPEGNGLISFTTMDAIPLGLPFTSLGDRVNRTRTSGSCFVAFIGNNTVALAKNGAANIEELQTATSALSTKEGGKVGVTKAALASAYGSRATAWEKGLVVKSPDGGSSLWFTITAEKVTAIALRPKNQAPLNCA